MMNDTLKTEQKISKKIKQKKKQKIEILNIK